MTTLAYPIISIITVTFNAASTLSNTIASVLNQTYPNLQYIIIDGKSSDGTMEIIDRHKARLAYWVSENDLGIYDAMNKGIRASKGEWILFMGADDVFINDEVLVNMFAEKALDTIDFLYGDVILKSNAKLWGGSRTYPALIKKNINHQCIFYKRKLFEEKGLFNLKYRILSDYAFNLALFRDENIIKMHVPKAITLYNDKGLSNQVIDGNFYEDQLQQFINVEGMDANDYRLQTYFFFYSYSLLLKGKWKPGFRYLYHALTTGRRKFYYCLVGIKYTLSLIGFFKKIKTSLVPEKQAGAGFLNHSK